MPVNAADCPKRSPVFCRVVRANPHPHAQPADAERIRHFAQQRQGQSGQLPDIQFLTLKRIPVFGFFPPFFAFCRLPRQSAAALPLASAAARLGYAPARTGFLR